jgi:hypothetical protein
MFSIIFDYTIDFADLRKILEQEAAVACDSPRFLIAKDVLPLLAAARVISTTLGRAKEGLSVQDLVWGACSKFPQSINARIQLLGRIRRNSLDPALNSATRLMIAVEGCHSFIDRRLEETMFAGENYVRIP